MDELFVRQNNLMEFEKLIPALAVLIGWSLAQLSSFFGAAKASRELRSQALPPFIDLYFEQYRTDMILKAFNLDLGDRLGKIVDSSEFRSLEKKERMEIMESIFSTFEKTRQINAGLSDVTEKQFFDSLSLSLIHI